MIDLENEQRNIGWFRARLGNITGSRVGDLMKAGRAKADTFGETAKTYMMQLAAERMMNPAIVEDDELFGQYLEQVEVSSKAMRFGQEMEDKARDLFSKMSGFEIAEASSCKHDRVAHFAASPDGIICVDLRPLAALEIKCPNQNTFVKYLGITDGESLKRIKPEYYWQTQAEMSCTDVNFAYFVAYCPWQKNPIHIALIERNPEDEALMLERIELANGVIDEICKTDEQRNDLPRIFREVYDLATAPAL